MFRILANVDVLEDRDVEEVFQSGLKVTVQISILENAFQLFAANIQVSLQNDPVLRQRARLVGAEYVHRAEVLNGIEPLNDDLGAGHRGGAFRQINRHDHGQHFRRQAHGYGDRKQKCLQPIMLGQAIDEKDERPHHNDETYHQPGEPVDASIESGRHVATR